MSKNSSGSTKKKTTAKSPDDEVEELLKAAQDDVLLKLTINSHMAHSSSQNFTIDPDLDSRFQSLKSKKSKSKLPRTSSALHAEKKNPKKDVDEEDDILARFSALKKSLPLYSESSRAGSGGVGNKQLQEHDLPDDNEDDEEDEVEKVIKWARDAARLDPSPPSDIEDSDVDNDEGDTDSDEEVFARKTSKKR